MAHSHHKTNGDAKRHAGKMHAAYLKAMKTGTQLSDVERVTECLKFINAGHDCSTHWRLGVIAEARKLGLLPAQKPQVGCNCRPGIDSRITYGGDMEDVF